MKRALLHAPLVLLAAAALSRGPGVKAESSWPFWSRYSGHFISSEGRIIDPDRTQMTTSEGQSYAMFFALVANDAASFERLRTWTENNLAHGDLAKNLPSWSWGKGNDGSWHVLDENSAADSDLWIAYDLLQAGTLWQKPEYTRSGKVLLANIAKEEVAQLPQVGPVLMPGRVELFAKDNRWILNPSYSPLPLLYAAGHASPTALGHRWHLPSRIGSSARALPALPWTGSPTRQTPASRPSAALEIRRNPRAEVTMPFASTSGRA